MKTCVDCGHTRPRRKFWTARARKDGLTPWCKECGKKRNHVIGLRVKWAALTHYSEGTPSCACCGETALEFLTIDHVGGGGNVHRRSTTQTGGRAFYVWLQKSKWPKGYRALCMNCNLSIGCYGYCPHQERRIDVSVLTAPPKSVKGENNGQSKLTADGANAIRLAVSRGESGSDVARRYGISYRTVRKIVRGELWRQ